MGFLDIENVTKSFGSVQVLHETNISVEEGEFLVLVGPSGCGKSTLLNMIAGLEEITSGEIFIKGRPMSGVRPADRNIAMVFQSYALYPTMTVRGNISFGLEMHGVPKAEREQAIARVAELLQIEPLLDRRPGQLSGGQRQRVALARAIVRRPSVFLMDEPLSNLDAKLRSYMRAELKHLQEELGITTIYVTHDQKEALSMADSIAVLDMGVIAQVGGPRALYDRPASRFVADFLGETNFLSAEVSSRTGDTITLSTAAGELQSTAFDAEATPERGNVTCSIRPEAWAFSVGEAPMSGADNISHGLKGVVAESIYLGEMAQHIVELPGETRVRVFELHPTKQIPAGSPISLMVKPDDVVVLRD